MDWMGNDKRAIAIVRVSSRRQQDGNSHDVQEREIREYCTFFKLELVDVVRITESAKDSEERVQYSRAQVKAIREGIRHHLYYMFDRETRNLTDNETNEKLVRADKLVIHYARDRKILHKDSPDSDFFLRDIQAVSNKQFIRNLSAKVTDSMRAKARAGWFPGNHPPLGYVHQRTRDDTGRELKRGTIIVPGPTEKTVQQVRREFELRADGLSYDGIREQIIAEGFVAPAKQSQYRANSVEKRLKNGFYYGELAGR